MTQYERMIKGLLYDPGDEEIMREQTKYQDALWEFNQLKPSDTEKKTAYLLESFAECGEGCYIELPFHANWGGHHVHFGSYIYANSNLTLVDDGHIYVGDRVMFAPNVTVATANHPLDAELRAKGLQYNRDVHIGEKTWIGAGAVIIPGVTVGRNCVIGAGSVVTKDIPDNSLAVGNPCRVLREIGAHDREFYYKNDRITDEDFLIGSSDN
ncbi:MAG: sugar O-acetyltransferase [Ruminococcus sp.]|nr:sugar O-acetyltransferase [Ruminococcus sp.]